MTSKPRTPAYTNFFHLVVALASQFYRHQIAGTQLCVLHESLLYGDTSRTCLSFDEWVHRNQKEVERLTGLYLSNCLPNNPTDEFDTDYSRRCSQLNYAIWNWLHDLRWLMAICDILGEKYENLPAAEIGALRPLLQSDFGYVTGSYANLAGAVTGSSACYRDTASPRARFTKASSYYRNLRERFDQQSNGDNSYSRFLDLMIEICSDGAKLESRDMPPVASIFDLGVRAVAVSLKKPADKTARAMYGQAMGGDGLALNALLDWFDDYGADSSMARDYLQLCREVGQ